MNRQWETQHQLELLSSPTTVDYHRIDGYSSIVEGVRRIRRILAGDFDGDNQRFIRACCSNDIETVKWLFERHDINLKTGVNRSALHEACLHSDGQGLVRFLCQHGADPKQRDSLGRSAFHYAASHGHRTVFTELIRFIRVPISTIIDREGRCPLMYACGEGHLELSQWLVEYCNADFERFDDYGRSCLIYACRNGHANVVQWLSTLISPQPTNTGWYPLHFACTGGHIDVVKILLQSFQQTSHHVITNTGHSALFMAMHAEKNHIDIVKYLLDNDSTMELTEQDVEDLNCDEFLIVLLAQRRHRLKHLDRILERLNYPLSLVHLLLLSEHDYSRQDFFTLGHHQLFIREQLRKPLKLKSIVRCLLRKSIDTSQQIDQLNINQTLKKFLHFESFY